MNGEAMLTEQQLIAVLAGAGDVHVLQKVRGIFEYAATMRVYEQGPIAPEDVVLTLDFNASYTRQEVLELLEVIRKRSRLTAAPKPVGGR